MASITKQIQIRTHPERAWDALRDFGALHKRLAIGFVSDTRIDGRDRIVTFFTGNVLRERLVTLDDETCRLVWSIIDGPYTHHNGAAQVLTADNGETVFTWTSDLLPDESAPRTAEMMEIGLNAIKQTLEGTGCLDP